VSDVVAAVLRQRLERGELWIDVAGDSMRPGLIAPARVRLRAGGTPRLGEVWAFAADDGSIVVHRCLAHLRDGTSGFRGDSAGVDDPSVHGERLIGRVVAGRDGRGPRRVRRRWSPVLRYQARRAVRSVVRRLG